MLENKFCKVEDLLLDDSFVEWVLGNSAEQDSYWENFLTKRPECAENLKQASNIILSFNIKPVNDLSSQEINEIILNVKSRYKLAPNPAIVALPKRRFAIINVMRYAAIIAVVISIGVLAYHSYRPQNKVVNQRVVLAVYHNVVNTSSVPMLIKLPDHSSVILKPLAQLRYPDFFTGAKREVNLIGEAFFEVSKNPKKPFFVYSNELLVRVVGTSFIVRANKGDNQYKIIVSTGKVEVCMHGGKNNPGNVRHSILLIPNQQVVAYRNDLRLEKDTLKKPLLLSKESTTVHFNFVNAPFSKVISTVEEAYGVNIIYDEKVMANCQLTASLIDQPLEERLSLICKAVEAEYKITDGHIVITGKGCNN